MENDGQEIPPDGSDSFDELLSESDRAVAVLCQAMLEEIIKRAISEKLSGDEKHKIHLVGDEESPGILGFADQCRLAHGLDIVNADALADLQLIGRIRNRFGHSAGPIEFTSRGIKDRCDSLKFFDSIPRIVKGNKRHKRMSETREKYVRCALAINRHIQRNMRRFFTAKLLENKREFKDSKKRIKRLATLIANAPDPQSHSPK